VQHTAVPRPHQATNQPPLVVVLVIKTTAEGEKNEEEEKKTKDKVSLSFVICPSLLLSPSLFPSLSFSLFVRLSYLFHLRAASCVDA
jgi:hypothetical protein